MKFDLILNDKGLALVINLLGEFRRNGMMGSCVLYDQTLIALHSLVHVWFFDGPFTDVCPFLVLVRTLGILLGVRWLPSCLPIICELFDKVTLDLGRLFEKMLVSNCRPARNAYNRDVARDLTVKVGSSGSSVAEVAADEASLATLATEELASLKTD